MDWACGCNIGHDDYREMKRPTGESGGYVVAGGPDYKGLKDE
jgi:hypothetical protein